MTPVTRFPPSPTGFMHIGNARTALYNWLYARRHGGTFLVRIEDTDRARHSEEAVEAIFNGLNWLGLDWDNEPVSQYEQRERHAAVARELLEKGQAYYCYCSLEELGQMRQEAKAEGRPVAYDRRWRDRDPSEAPGGIDPVIRIKAPLDGKTVIHDEVQGEVTIRNDHLDDFILLRSDGIPTYMLAVVVDDHDMGVTHVIRGDDHLNNAFRQKVIFEAMGWDVPIFAHLPLILGPDGGKMSKRHGAVSVEEYRDMGYLPESMKNYLLRLGWSHGDDEIISMEQAVEWFDLEHIGKSAARFDFGKLENLNGHYIAQADNVRLLELVIPILKERKGVNIASDEAARTRIMAAMDELKDRTKTLLQLSDEAFLFCMPVSYDFDEKAQKNLSAEVLEPLQKRFTDLDELTAETVEQACRELADEIADGKLGKIAMPLRAALTGTTISPSVFTMAAILGKDEVLDRLAYALKEKRHD